MTVTVNGAPVQFMLGVRFSPTPIVPVGVTVYNIVAGEELTLFTLPIIFAVPISPAATPVTEPETLVTTHSNVLGTEFPPVVLM